MTDKNKKPAETEIESPYLDGRNDWNEIMGREKSDKAMWRMFALLELIPMIICIFGMIYVSQLPDVVPFIFKEDGSGGITALGIPNKELKVDNRIIANQLATFVEDLRQVPSSNEIRSTYVHRVKMMATQDLFRSKLSPMLKEEYANIGTGTQSITINSVFPVSKDTWEIDWTEYKNSSQSGKYKAIINYARNPVPIKDPTEIVWNPIGLLVKDISINQVIGN